MQEWEDGHACETRLKRQPEASEPDGARPNRMHSG